MIRKREWGRGVVLAAFAARDRFAAKSYWTTTQYRQLRRLKTEYSLSGSSRPRALACVILSSVSKYALECEFHDCNKVSCDVEC